jgi:hypothetical protein
MNSGVQTADVGFDGKFSHITFEAWTANSGMLPSCGTKSLPELSGIEIVPPPASIVAVWYTG